MTAPSTSPTLASLPTTTSSSPAFGGAFPCKPAQSGTHIATPSLPSSVGVRRLDLRPDGSCQSVRTVAGFFNASAPHQKEVAAIAATAAAAQTSEFFEAYANLGVHELMLRDRSRTETYRAAIEDALLRVVSGRAGADGGKGGAASAENAPVRVLDVGAGTGVLSMFAAKAAAATGVKVEVRCCIRLLL